LVPDSKVEYPNTTIGLVEVPHRAADPAIRYYFGTELDALADGDAVPLAKRNPTALLYGLWDSRHTQVRLPRIITSNVIVRGAVNQPSASSLSSPFDDETRQQLIKETGAKASEIGVDQVPDFKQEGTLDTTGATIERRVFLSLSLLDKYPPVLRDYLKGLALVALLYPVPLDLRSGTSLVRQSRRLEVFSDNEMSSSQVDLKGAFEEVLAFARNAANAFGIGKPETLTVDTQKIAEGMKAFDARKSAKKEAKRVKKAGA
jgi:CRISPR-associated protein Csb1